jgi:predicted transcriptional regulator
VSDTTTTDAGALLALLGDEYVQQILVATDEEPLSARDLSERLDAARSTVYDRTERMAEHDLLVERTRIVDDGSHHAVYVANVDHLDVDVVDGELVASVETSESAAERFTTIWNDIRGV